MPRLERLVALAPVQGPSGADEPELEEEDVGEVEDLECPICAELLSDAVACPCKHVFCRHCIGRALHTGAPRCPLCRQDVEEGALETVPLLNLRAAGVAVCCPRQCGWRGRCDQRQAHWYVCPVSKSDEFAVVLEGELGLCLVLMAENLPIARVEEGHAADMHNQRMACCPEQQIRPLCMITEANGVRGDPGKLTYLIQRARSLGDPVRLVIRRPVEFCAKVEKKARPLGLTLKIPDGKGISFLVVEGVEPEGAISEYNSHAEEQVKTEDHIVEVNGHRGTWEQLLERMRREETCSLRMVRALASRR